MNGLTKLNTHICISEMKDVQDNKVVAKLSFSEYYLWVFVEGLNYSNRGTICLDKKKALELRSILDKFIEKEEI